MTLFMRFSKRANSPLHALDFQKLATNDCQILLGPVA
jgi:hypothetical protein